MKNYFLKIFFYKNNKIKSLKYEERLVFTMKNRRNTYLYNNLDKAKIEKAMSTINWQTELVPASSFEDDLKIFSRRYSYGLKNIVIDSYVKGNILTVYPLTNDIPKLIPIFLIKSDTGIKSVINIKPYASKNKNGNFEIDEKRLYAFLECAYIAKCIQEVPEKFATRTKVLRLATMIYVKLFNKVLDKLYAINLQPSLSDRINFAIANFFLRYVVEKTNDDLINDVAAACTFNASYDIDALKSFTSSFMGQGYYESLPNFIEGLQTVFPELSSLTLRAFLENFMIMFGEVGTLSLESFPDLLQTVFFGVVFNIQILKDYMIDSTVGKETLQLHDEITQLLS